MAGSTSASVNTGFGADGRRRVPSYIGRAGEKNRQAFHALGTAYYQISRLNLKTKKIELVKRSRKTDLDIKDNIADWKPQFKIIEDIIAEPFVQKYIDFFLQKTQ